MTVNEMMNEHTNRSSKLEGFKKNSTNINIIYKYVYAIAFQYLNTAV